MKNIGSRDEALLELSVTCSLWVHLSKGEEMSKPVHLVGSIPLDAVEDVFREVSKRLGSTAKRVPDGELGGRLGWTAWQNEVMAKCPDLQQIGTRNLHGFAFPTHAPKPGVAPDQIRFGETGYAEAAKSSYTIFDRLRSQGFNENARFQVCLPTAFAVVQGFFWGSPVLQHIWAAYERRMLADLDEILKSIPHKDLSIQWDIAVELHRIWERPDSELARQVPLESVDAAIVRITDHVPEDVEVGWHFCYGDAGHKHFVEPRDTGTMVIAANRLLRATKRRLDWLHMPVPRARDDVAYFAKLSDLKLPGETELYLGLVHFTDGLEGTQRRMAAADSVVTNYGVATECGFGRRKADTIRPLLDLHKAAAAL